MSVSTIGTVLSKIIFSIGICAAVLVVAGLLIIYARKQQVRRDYSDERRIGLVVAIICLTLLLVGAILLSIGVGQ